MSLNSEIITISKEQLVRNLELKLHSLDEETFKQVQQDGSVILIERAEASKDPQAFVSNQSQITAAFCAALFTLHI